MEKNIHTFIGCGNSYEESKIVIFGAPFDSTTSYRPGARFASAAMRNESYGIETYSPYIDRDLEDIMVFDGGDLELCFGSPERALEDIENFASVLYTAKRSGGDLGNVIQKVARMLGDKIDVKKEIEATLAAKKSEQMIMSLMPAGIILYLQLASPGFLDILYGNPFGICAMTVCLTVYGAAYWMGKRIVEIEV